MKKILLGFGWLLFFPVIVSNLNLKTVYMINTLNRQINELEKENAYMKKKIFEQTTLTEVSKKAFAMGFDIAEPSTIIIIEKKNSTSKKFFADASIIQTISKLISKTDKT